MQVSRIQGFKFIFFKVLRWSVLLFFGSSIVVTILFRFINPPVTPLMMIRVVENISEGKKPSIQKDWLRFSKISNNLKFAVIASEDNNFMSHYGVDFKAIEKAQALNKKGKKLRGASTISQQTAKNVFLWPSRTWLRKGLEVYFTGLIEVLWGKQRIMEVYLNVIEMGDGVYGAEAAAQRFFNKSAQNLNASEAAAIAAILPGPRKWRPDKPTPYIARKKMAILRAMNNIEKPDW